MGDRGAHRALAAAVAAAGVCVATQTLWWHAQFAASTAPDSVTFFNLDQYHYTLPAFHYAAERLRDGQLPLWNPQQLCGGAFLATQLHGLLYPLHWVIALLPLDTVWKVLLITHGIVAMTGTFTCARVFGARTFPALLAGVMYSLSATVTTVATFSMEPAFVSLVWLPWQLALTHLTLRAESRWVPAAVGLGFAGAACLLGGHLPYLPVAILVCGLYAAMSLAALLWRLGWRAAAARAVRLPFAAAVAAGVAAVQIIPTLELASRSVRMGAFPSAQAADPFPIGLDQLLFGLVESLPDRFGLSHQPFMGVVAVGLPLIPLITRRHRRRALSLWVLACVATLLALGTQTPVFGWYFQVQGQSLRLPQRFLAGTCLSLALLSALGADALCRERRMTLILLAVVVTVAAPLILIVTVPAELLAKGPRLSAAVLSTRSHTWWLAALASAFLLPWGWCRRYLRPAIVFAAVPLLAYELFGAMALIMAIPATNPHALRTPVQAAAFLRTHEGLTRVVTPIPMSSLNQVPVRVGMLEHLQVISDYEPLVDRRFANLMWTLSSRWGGPQNAHLGPFMNELTAETLPLLRFLGVGFVLVTRQRGTHVLLPGPIYNDAETEIYAVPDSLPRAYVARDIRAARTEEQARNAVLADPSWIIQGGAVVEHPDLQVQGSRGSITVRRYAPEEVELDAELSSPGLVVLQDQYDPYWRASVDGVDVPIVRTNYVFRGVLVDAGRHAIRFWYRPMLVYAGAAVTLFTLVALAAGLLWRRRAFASAPPAPY